MARPQLVGRKIVVGNGLTTAGATISLTDLTGGLSSQPSEDDNIYIAFGAAGTADLTLQINDAGSTAYELVGTELYANDTHDANLRVAWKRAGATPDTEFIVDTSATTRAYVVMVEVWRDATTGPPETGTATGTNTGLANPPSRLPTITDSNILVFGVAATADTTGAAFTSSDLTDFQSQNSDGSAAASDMAGGMGYKEWTSGTFDPAAFGGGSSNTANSWAAVSLNIVPYIRPVERVGNTSNSANNAETSITATAVTGQRAGDLLIAVLSDEKNAGISTPSGWTSIYTEESTGYLRAAFWRYAASSSTGITISASTSFGAAGIQLHAFRYADPDLTSLTFASSSNTNNPPSVGSVLANDMVLAVAHASNSIQVTTTAPSGYSNLVDTRVDDSTTTALNQTSSVTTANKSRTAAGTEDPGAFSPSWSTSPSKAVTILIPAAGLQTQDLTPSLLTNSQTFYGPAVTTSYTLAPSLLSNAQTFHAPAITTTVSLAPALFTNSQTFYGPTVTQGATLAPTLLTNEQTFFAPTVSVGPVTLEPGLLTNAQTFHAPTVSSNYTLAPGLFENAQTFFGAAISATYTLAPPLLENAQTFYAADLTNGVTITAPLLTNDQTFFAPTVLIDLILAPTLLTNSQTFYAAAITITIEAVTPPGRRLVLAASRASQRRLALTPSIAAHRRLALSASRLEQRRLAITE